MDKMRDNSERRILSILSDCLPGQIGSARGLYLAPGPHVWHPLSTQTIVLLLQDSVLDEDQAQGQADQCSAGEEDQSRTRSQSFRGETDGGDPGPENGRRRQFSMEFSEQVQTPS